MFMVSINAVYDSMWVTGNLMEMTNNFFRTHHKQRQRVGTQNKFQGIVNLVKKFIHKHFPAVGRIGKILYPLRAVIATSYGYGSRIRDDSNKFAAITYVDPTSPGTDHQH